MIKIEKRRTPQTSTTIMVAVGATVISLIISALILIIMDYDAISVFSTTFSKTYFTKAGIYENFLMLIPLALCALGVVVSTKAGLWNIGVEGQFYIGAAAATGLALAFPNMPAIILIPLMLIAGMLAGGILCYLSVLPRVYYGISEILTTILVNSIVLYFVRYLVYDAWADPTTVAAQTSNFGSNAILGIMIPGSRIHYGILIAIALLFICWYYLNKTVYGFELRMVGENARGAKYSGVNVKKHFFIAMLVSGLFAGAAGMLEVSGVTHRLQATISADYGFSAFVIAWIARLNIGAIVIVSYLFAGLIVAGYKMQMMGFPPSIIYMLKGLILILVLTGEFLAYYKITFASKKNAAKLEAKSNE